jgi:hypothetical protein
MFHESKCSFGKQSWGEFTILVIPPKLPTQALITVPAFAFGTPIAATNAIPTQPRFFQLVVIDWIRKAAIATHPSIEPWEFRLRRWPKLGEGSQPSLAARSL